MNTKVIVITGGSSGIGAAAARALREQGATVVITGRSPATAQVAREIGADYVLADFARFRDVHALADQLLTKYPRIDVLANNVGGIVGERQITDDGHEKTLQVNHLSPFLLTLLLRERLEASRGIVINTASAAHRMAQLRLDDLESARSFSPWTAYGTAKLMNILHAAEINRRFHGVSGVSFHPGVVATGFAREGNVLSRFLYNRFTSKLLMLSPERGADTLVWLVTTAPGAQWQPGGYYVQRRSGAKSAEASDPDLASRLWDESERLVAKAGASLGAV